MLRQPTRTPPTRMKQTEFNEEQQEPNKREPYMTLRGGYGVRLNIWRNKRKDADGNDFEIWNLNIARPFKQKDGTLAWSSSLPVHCWLEVAQLLTTAWHEQNSHKKPHTKEFTDEERY